ncbi:MAG: tetratricopeptide repeat protein [Alphaproteobacteria bacterium]
MDDPAEPQAAGAAQAGAAARKADAGALHRAAVEAHRAGRLQEAIAGYRRVIALSPELASAYNNMGAALYMSGQFAAAAAWYRQAIQLGDEDARGNLGEAYRKLGRLAEAETLQREALARNPGNELSRFALAQTLRDAGWLEDALATYDEILNAAPGNVKAAWNRALVLLQLGRYGEGFKAYEARFERPESPARRLDAPRWDGGALDGRTILVHDEQGYGDAIQFARFVPLVAARGGRVVLQCAAPLVRLMRSLEGVAEVIAQDDAAPPHEAEAPLLSLPAILGITDGTLPSPGHYLAPPADLIEHFAPLTARRGGLLKIGIAWAGRPDQRDDHKRSIGLANFVDLIGLPGIALFGLQVGPRAADVEKLGLGGLIADLSPRLDDFAATAAAIEALDLVISIDSAVAHLAGALAKPVWLALSFTGDWRYLSKCSDSPWYPSMRIFRQPRFGDWDGVFRDIASALELRDGLAPRSDP